MSPASIIVSLLIGLGAALLVLAIAYLGVFGKQMKALD